MSQISVAKDDVVEVAQRWEALFEGAGRNALEKALPAWVAARRWYRTKTKNVQSARLVARFPFAHAHVTLVELVLDDGARDTYVLPLTFLTAEDATRMGALALLSLRVVGVGRRKSEAREGFVVDALAYAPFLDELLASFRQSAVVTDAGTKLRFHPLPFLAVTARGREAPARLVDGEQTNSSILFGDRFVGKVVRKVEAGESTDLEMGRFLTAARFGHTPALAGWIDVHRDDEPSTVGLLHAFVPNQGDAWKHVLGVLDRWLGEVAQRDGAPPALPRSDLLTRAGEPLSPTLAAAIGEYAGFAELLGRRVGEMHVALASRTDDPAFAPEPLDRASYDAIVGTVRRDLARVLDALGAHGDALPEEARTSLAEVRRRVNSFAARLDAVGAATATGVRIRVHGDLHLGQVLFTGQDFAIIDFEGEPARPLAERRAKRSPLVDVAGMLRSFHYAVVSALGARPEVERAALAPWTTLWHRTITATFLGGWLASVEGSVVVPSEPRITRALLDLFLLEKGIYEVGYEMNNRPSWVGIPLEGLREIVTADGDTRNVAVTSTRRAPRGPVLDPASPAIAAFRQGKATHAHALLGAHPHQDGATDFAVWAPHASRVAVIGDFDAWGQGSPLEAVGETGLFAGRVAAAQPGQRYKFRITSDSATIEKADPFAMSAETEPGFASVIASLAYAWADGPWMENRFQGSRLDRPMSIYEVHLGSWRRNVEEGGRMLGYREIAAPLAAHAKEMGFTHVELMPVLEHPFYGSWGYGVTGFFAATSRYGSPTDLMFLVDTLHQAGLGVIFDWVPAHFAGDPHGLAAFDGAPLFEPADPELARHPTWETGLFDFAKPEVRSFLVSSAMHWIETFHADGLRVDGVASILHLNHGHDGQPLKPNEAGIAFLRELTGTLKLQHPEVILAAEDSSAFPGVTRAVAAGGLGFDLTWDLGFSHDMRAYLKHDPIERSRHQDALTFRSAYAASESFVLALSHDDVIAERGGSLLEQMHGDPWQKLANLRLLFAMAWAQPGKKLLFMGSELAQLQAWHHDRSLDWHVGHETSHAGIARLVGDLNRLYKDLPALHAGDASPDGFAWIDGENAALSVIAFLRRGRGDDDVVLVACNFTPVPRHQYRIGVPRGGRWRELFDSDATIYGGSGQGNLGGVEAVPYPWNGRPFSIVVTLPPLGAIILGR